MELTNTCFSNGVGLARACLPICKHGHIKAFKEGLYQWLHTSCVHGLLAGCFGEDTINVEVAVSSQSHFFGLWVSSQASLVPMQSLLGQQGPDAHSHPNTSLLHQWLGPGFLAHVQQWLKSQDHWKMDGGIIPWAGRLQKEERLD